MQYVVEPSREILLPDPLPAPYLQPKYTLVIEMKNVLIAPEWTVGFLFSFYKTGHRFVKRPALDYFLDIVGYPNFEVVIYTSESSMTAPQVIESFDPKQRIMYKLYRDCTKYMNGHHVKCWTPLPDGGYRLSKIPDWRVSLTLYLLAIALFYGSIYHLKRRRNALLSFFSKSAKD
ncbi:unnamed protein product [Toxocara canis]|uniref:Mitochondrial import inner membrane translocase subunit TIM50 n=1 Tax=Toxocara canis TaxID=6265 RepID=A0A3P7F753_TOXCA|nr:unnamed protein product [Toxocara canis]